MNSEQKTCLDPEEVMFILLKIQYFRLVRELEKKFSGKHVVFIAQRRILPKPTRKANKLKQKRPISRTLTAVHDSILDDLVYPAEIVGKRIRIRLDGTRLIKVKYLSTLHILTR